MGQTTGADERLVNEIDGSVRRRRVQRLLRANKVVASEFNLPALYRQLSAVGGQLVDRSSSSMVVLDPDGAVDQLLEWSASRGIATSTQLDPEGIEQLSRLVNRLSPQLVRRLCTSEHAAPARATPWLPGDLVVPVTYRGTLLAVLNVHQDRSRAFGVADRDILASFGITAGIAIENARLYEDSRQREIWLEHAATLSSGLLGSAEQEAALGLVVASVRQLADADHAALWMSNGHAAASVASAAGWHGTLSRPSVRDSVARAALDERQGVRTSAAAHPESPLALAAAKLGAGPLLAFPFGTEGGLSGLMVVLRRTGRTPFSGFELDRAIEFTTQLALAVEVLSARALQHRLVLVTERERLATNLRDDVVQDLYAAGLKASSLAAGMGAGAPQSKLEEVVTILQGCVVQLRQSIVELKHDRPASQPAAQESFTVRREGPTPRSAERSSS